MQKLSILWDFSILGTIILIIVLLLLFVSSMGLSLGRAADAVQSASADPLARHNDPQTEAHPIDNTPITDFDHMSPAEASGNGKPTLYFFTPAELCQIRYCRQAEEVGRSLQAHYQDRINFVPVTVHAIADYDGSEPYPQLMYENWDIWPTAPYSTWLPKPTMTAVGLGLAGPEAVLVDRESQLVYRGGEFFELAMLAGYLKAQ